MQHSIVEQRLCHVEVVVFTVYELRVIETPFKLLRKWAYGLFYSNPKGGIEKRSLGPRQSRQ